MDFPTVVVDDYHVDMTLASRLVVAALDQMLFFKGQIPMPMARLPLLPAQPGDRSSKKRKEFLDGHHNLVQDILGVLRSASYAFSSLDDSTFSAIQAVFVLGTLSVPRARFALSLEGLEATVQNTSAVCTAPDSPDADEPHEENGENDEEPPESASESEDSESENPHTKATLFATPQPIRSSFTPFSDESSPSSSSMPTPSTSNGPATSRIALFGTPPERAPFAFRHSDENATFKSNIERRYKATERDVCLKLASMDGIIEDVDTSKIQVYICAPRTVEHDRWLPRATLRTKLDNTIREGFGQNIAQRGKRLNYSKGVEKRGPRIDALRIASAAANRSLASRSPVLRPKNVEAQEVEAIDEEEGDNMWFQWDGKLSGIPVEP